MDVNDVIIELDGNEFDGVSLTELDISNDVKYGVGVGVGVLIDLCLDCCVSGLVDPKNGIEFDFDVCVDAMYVYDMVDCYVFVFVVIKNNVFGNVVNDRVRYLWILIVVVVDLYFWNNNKLLQIDN